MRTLRLALSQINPTVGDLDGNFALIAAAIERARGLGADLLALPEMAITGYPPEALLPLSRGLTVVVGTIEREIDLFNAAAVMHDGEWMGTYRKRYLPNYGVFDENRYFMPATKNPVF